MEAAYKFSKGRKKSNENDISNEEIVYSALEGVNISKVEELTKKYQIKKTSIAEYLGINAKTIANYENTGRDLEPQEGEKILKIQRLWETGLTVFGSKDSFSQWLSKPAYGLDNQIPERLLVTSEGINMVSDEIQRIAFGDLV
jgi:putative toxin-antitoxin system antitoxin component (TIGR02293 family)